MTEIHSELNQSLKALRLPIFRKCDQSEAALARQESLSHEDYLFERVKRECEERAHKQDLLITKRDLKLARVLKKLSRYQG